MASAPYSHTETQADGNSHLSLGTLVSPSLGTGREKSMGGHSQEVWGLAWKWNLLLVPLHWLWLELR